MCKLEYRVLSLYLGGVDGGAQSTDRTLGSPPEFSRSVCFVVNSKNLIIYPHMGSLCVSWNTGFCRCISGWGG